MIEKFRKSIIERISGINRINVVLCLIIALSVSWLMNNRKNSLHENGNWVSEKVQLKKGVMGSVAYLTTRVALNQNRLNLNAWHGYQSIELKKKIDYTEVSFDFSLEDELSYLIFYFSKKGEDRLGLLLSRNSDFTNSFVVVDGEGKFTHQKSIELEDIENGTVQLNINSTATTVQINNKKYDLPRLLEKYLGNKIVGFRGSYNKVIVDNISIDPNRPSAFFEDFTHKGDIIDSTFKIFLSIILCLFIFNLLTKNELKYKVSITLLSISLAFIDNIYLSSLYNTENHKNSSLYPINVESAEQVKIRLNKLISKLKETTESKILFLGTSQTWGSGAKNNDDTFVTRLESLLNENKEKKKICINAGVLGWKLKYIIKEYEENWMKFSPSIVVLNLSYNDYAEKNFAINLQKLIDINNAANIETIFILEAMSKEVRGSFIEVNHQVMKSIAQKNNIQFINMHQYLASKQGQGLIWWDSIHLSSFGQELVANKIYPTLLN
jgi:lysophospholipase L1-like esterase